jgi:hypothetical protein
MTATGRAGLRLRWAHRPGSANPVIAAGVALADATIGALLLGLDITLATLARTDWSFQAALGGASWWLVGIIAVLSVLYAFRAVQLSQWAEPVLRRGRRAGRADAVLAQRLALAVLAGWTLFLLLAA